jgi:hypothetical protein
LADGFLTGLKDAVRDRRPFDPRTGLPEVEVTEDEAVTWYAHTRAYAEAKWANLAPVSRRSVAEALVIVTIALSKKEPGAPDSKVLRQALFSWAFNPATRDTTPPPHIAAALDWAERASLPVTDLENTATVRLALAACAATLAGKPAAGSTRRGGRRRHRAGILKWQVKAGIRMGAVCKTAPTAPVRGLFRPRPWAGPWPSVGQPSTVCRPLGPRNPVSTDA